MANAALTRGFEGEARAHGESVMTVSGAVNKTLLFLVMMCATGTFTWYTYFQALRSGGSPSDAAAAVVPYMIGGLIGGIVFALITIFYARGAAIFGSLYALSEGLALGGISAFFEERFPGIAVQAVLGTTGVLLVMLLAFKLGLEATPGFVTGVVAATGGIALIYLVDLVLGMFGTRIPGIHGSGWIGIGFSVVVVIVAALNLIIDFTVIREGAKAGAPKHMEWYSAFGLLLTLVWLYIEILNLLAKARRASDN